MIVPPSRIASPVEATSTAAALGFPVAVKIHSETISHKSDVGGVLQAKNIHIKTCAEGEATATLTTLRESPATTRAKAKFILATDGIEAETFAVHDIPGSDHRAVLTRLRLPA